MLERCASSYDRRFRAKEAVLVIAKVDGSRSGSSRGTHAIGHLLLRLLSYITSTRSRLAGSLRIRNEQGQIAPRNGVSGLPASPHSMKCGTETVRKISEPLVPGLRGCGKYMKRVLTLKSFQGVHGSILRTMDNWWVSLSPIP